MPGLEPPRRTASARYLRLAVPTTDTVYFPHFATGGGWTTQVILVNSTHATIAGNVQFFGSGGETEAAAPATLTLDDGRTGSTFSYSIPPRSAARLRTSNPAGPLQVGSVRAVPDIAAVGLRLAITNGTTFWSRRPRQRMKTRTHRIRSVLSPFCGFRRLDDSVHSLQRVPGPARVRSDPVHGARRAAPGVVRTSHGGSNNSVKTLIRGHASTHRQGALDSTALR